jgi:hypothetical protein
MQRYKFEPRTTHFTRDDVNQINKLFEQIGKDIAKSGSGPMAAKPAIAPSPNGVVNLGGASPGNITEVNKGGSGSPGPVGPPGPAGTSSVVTDGVTITGDGNATLIALIEPFLFATRDASVSPDAVLSTDQFIRASASAGADIIENLPASVGPDANGRSRVLIFKKMDANAHNVVITAAGADTIDGAATVSITKQYDAMRLWDAAAGQWSVW